MYDHQKHELLEEMKECASQPLTSTRVDWLATCKSAYDALCMLCDKEHKKSYSGWYDVDVNDDESEMHITRSDGKPHKLTEEQLVHWVDNMVNEDGTNGGHFTLEQAEKAMHKIGADCDPYEFWAGINAIYSDIGAELKRFGVTNIDSYAAIAYEYWFDDADAVKDKLAAYYHNVVKH